MANDIVFYFAAEHWRESAFVGNLIYSSLIAHGATNDEALSIDRADFDDLLDDFHRDVVKFLEALGHVVWFDHLPQRHGVGEVVDTCTPEQRIDVDKALEAASKASSSAYRQRAASLLSAIREEAKAQQDAFRLSVFDDAIELLEELAADSRIDAGHSQRINQFLAKVGKNMKATVMTPDRRKVMIDSSWMQSNASLMYYTQATDGVWVPICDLKQYESGNRPFSS